MSFDISTADHRFETRPARRDDIEALIRMCREHARYEKVTFDANDVSVELTKALFESKRLHAWVAEANVGLIGYATATVDFATWSAREYLSMDCLFVREHWRGHGVGAALLNFVVNFAARCGFSEIQWQTPAWNRDAVKFYRREGASAVEKMRFTLKVDPMESHYVRL